MLFLEFDRVGKPAERVAKRADREVHQHLAIRGRIFVHEDALALLPDLQPKAHIIALGAVDASGLELGLEQDVAGIEIAQSHAPGMLGFRQHDAAAIVEIEQEAFGPCCVGMSAGAG